MSQRDNIGSMITYTAAGYALAANEHEAQGKLLEEAKRVFPYGEGYYNHSVSVEVVPHGVLRMVLASCEAESDSNHVSKDGNRDHNMD